MDSLNRTDFELIKESLKNIKEEHIEHIKNNNNIRNYILKVTKKGRREEQ